MQIIGKLKDGEAEKSFSVEYPMPETLNDLVAKFSEDGVYQLAKSRLVVNIQNVIRQGVKEGDPEADITEAALNWMPGQRKERETKTPFERLMAQLASGGLSEEDKAALKAALSGKKAA